MPGLVPGIHVLLFGSKDVDGRDEPGHDGKQSLGGASATKQSRGGLHERWIASLRSQ